jgi:Family of unknown function (DUF5675)
MILELKAFKKTDKSTISKLYVDGSFECYTLEDFDRGIHDYHTLAFIEYTKVHGKTAIPEGEYKVDITLSRRFGVMMPVLLNVKGFEGIRIHPGNTEHNTEGCILPGSSFREDFVGGSKLAYEKLFTKLKAAKQSKQSITIIIKR